MVLLPSLAGFPDEVTLVVGSSRFVHRNVQHRICSWLFSRSTEGWASLSWQARRPGLVYGARPPCGGGEIHHSAFLAW